MPNARLAGVSVAIFAIFTCTSFESGNSYLDADARIMCYDSIHRRYIGGAVVWLLLVPVGVPAFFLFLLRRFKVPQMAALLSDNALLQEAIKLAWAESLAQPANAGTLTVDSISTLHLEALFAFFLHDVTAEDAAEILAGARPPFIITAGAIDEDLEDASPKMLSTRIALGANKMVHNLSGSLGKLAGVKSAVSKRIVLIKSVAAKLAGQDEAVARRALVLTSLLTHLRSSDDVAVPMMVWERQTDDEAAALALCSPDAVSVHASGLRCADVPQLMDSAMAEVSFLFAAYRMDCWYWYVPYCAHAAVAAPLHADVFAAGVQGGGGAHSKACAYLYSSAHCAGKRWAGGGWHSHFVRYACSHLGHVTLCAEKTQLCGSGCTNEPVLPAFCCSAAQGPYLALTAECPRH